MKITIKKIPITVFTFFMLSLIAGAQPIQYFMQRSITNIASMSETQSLQVFLNAQHSFVGFEGAPKNISLNITSPIAAQQRIGYNQRNKQPTRNFIGGTVMHKSYGTHTTSKAIIGYSYRFFVGDRANITFGVGAGIKTMNSNYGRLEPETADYSKDEKSLAMQMGARFEVDRLSISTFNNDNEVFGEIVWGRLWDESNVPSSSYGYDDMNEKNWHGQIAVMARHDRLTKTNVFGVSAHALYRDGLGIGISYQTEKDLSASMSLRFTKHLRIGYAYQLLNLNSMAPKHEIAVKYRLIRNTEN